jgi:hypothetical protein
VAMPGTSGGSPGALDTLVEQVRVDAGFEVVLLADLQGHVLAAARSEETTPETLGSLLDVAARMAARPEDRSRLADAGESTFFDWAGRQAICRWFTAHQPPQVYLLVILAPRGKPHKRAAGHLVREVQRRLGS